MRWAVCGRGLLGGLVTREVAMRLAVVDVTTVVGTQNHWQPPQLASDVLLLLNAQSGTLRCGRVDQRAVCEALGLVSWASRLKGLLHGRGVVAHVAIVHPALLIGPVGDGLGGDDLRRIESSAHEDDSSAGKAHGAAALHRRVFLGRCCMACRSFLLHLLLVRGRLLLDLLLGADQLHSRRRLHLLPRLVCLTLRLGLVCLTLQLLCRLLGLVGLVEEGRGDRERARFVARVDFAVLSREGVWAYKRTCGLKTERGCVSWGEVAAEREALQGPGMCGGSRTVSPANPMISSGNGVLCATVKSSGSW
eukprot:scaffold109261_cov69-Phaeocystis_antarctica.AAC.4